MLLTLLAAWTVLSLAAAAAFSRLARENVALDDLVDVSSRRPIRPLGATGVARRRTAVRARVRRTA